MLEIIAAVLVALIAATTGLVVASDGAGPGDPLYGVDRAVEQVQLDLAFSPEARAELQIAFARERLAEFTADLQKGDSANAQAAQAALDQSMAAIQAYLQSASLPAGVQASLQSEVAALQDQPGAPPVAVAAVQQRSDPRNGSAGSFGVAAAPVVDPPPAATPASQATEIASVLGALNASGSTPTSQTAPAAGDSSMRNASGSGGGAQTAVEPAASATQPPVQVAAVQPDSGGGQPPVQTVASQPSSGGGGHHSGEHESGDD